MMNKTQIEYCDFTWNPVTGCLSNCEYCYTMPQLRRFAGDVRINKGSPQLIKESPKLYILPKPFKNPAGTVIPSPVGTTPTLHQYRLPMIARKQKPATILVCSQADLFEEWIPDEWIRRVFEACEAAPWHNYLFLTKNPQRYHDLLNAGNLPQQNNHWYGTTITEPGAPTFCAKGYNNFVNIEPLLKPFPTDVSIQTTWIILGVETGSRRGKVQPDRKWIQAIVNYCRHTGTLLFMKTSDELCEIWNREIIQELPDGLKRPPDIPIPHCRECEHCIIKPDGKRGSRCFCKMGSGKSESVPQHIEGRYTRTCPPWCRLRSGDNSVGQKWEHELLKNQ